MSNGWKSKGQFFFIFCLTFILLTTACTSNGNSGAKDPESPANENKSATETKSSQKPADPYEALPKQVSISTFDRGLVSSDEGTYEENRWVNWIREQSGIDVTIVPVPRNQAQDSLNVLFASGQAPDLVWEFDRTYIGKLVTQGVIQPIGDYIERYSTTYKKYLEENSDLLPHITFNGEIYAAVTKRPITSVANHAIWIRQDWLDELNLKQPKTAEELIEVAKAFKEHYPDSTPIVGVNLETIIASLHGAVFNQWYLEDGKMKYGPTLDRYADAIAYQKQLYDLGLLDKEYLTDTNNQRSIQLWTTGKAGIWMSQWSQDTQMRDLMTNVPEARPEPLEAVSTKHGKYGTYQESLPFIYVAFNKDMKNPKAAMEYLDWILEEGWFTLVNGQEGVHYQLVDGVAKRLDADKYTKEVGYANEYGVLRNEIVKPEHLMIKAADDEMSQRIAALNSKSLETALRTEFRRDIPYQPVFDEMNEIRSTLDTFVTETRATAVTQGPNYTAEWAVGEIRNEWARLGGTKAEELAQQWYEENKGNF